MEIVREFKTRPINDVSDFISEVDIVIPYYGHYEKVTNLIESIIRFTRSNYYKIYVVDDNSPNFSYASMIQRNANNSSDRLKQERFLTVIRNEEQLGFGGACEVGYKAGTAPYVCFIHSDCLISNPNWLKNMGEALLNLKSKNVRVVSPQANNSGLFDKGFQERGQFDISAKDNTLTEEDKYYILNENESLSLYCFMCHRELFSRIGGFIKNYPLGCYEDDEFAFRLNHYGFKQGVCRNSWVHHDGSLTLNSLKRERQDYLEIMDQNKQSCIDDIKKLLKK